MGEEMLSFEEILNTVSDDKVMVDYPSLFRDLRQKMKESYITPDIQRFYIAYYAKMAAEHVGFSQFSKESQQGFKSEIERLYANISENKKQQDFLEEMASRTVGFIEDRHFEVNVGGKMFHGGKPKADRTVGKNFAYRTREEKPDTYQEQGKAVGRTDTGEEFPIWEIGTMKKGNEDILVVSVYDIAHRDNSYEAWSDFIEKFDEIYLTSKDKWEKGRIIFDVRGNRGGEDKPIDHVAKRLYGNMVNTYKRCEIKDTSLGNWILHKHGAFKPQNYEKDGLKNTDIVQRKCFSGENKVLFDETQTFYPFNEKDGYKGRIDILLCSRVGSSAESAYSSFYHHPNVRYIGENTHGMQQYTQGTFNTPWGGSMRVGWGKLTYWDKEGENIEVVGHKPDVNCSGKDAFDVALSMDRDEGRIIGFREKNEAVCGKQSFVEYNPKVTSDLRKAYYAKYINPALGVIEEQNKRDRVAQCLGRAKSHFATKDNIEQENSRKSCLVPNVMTVKVNKGNDGM